MRLLLVNAIPPGKPRHVIQPPLGLGYIASFLRERMPGVEIKIVAWDVKSELERFCPDIVGISSFTLTYGVARDIARLCKGKALPVIVGGVHISALPATLAPEMDVGVIGEGEETMLDIMQVFSEYGLNYEKLSEIKGLLFRNKAGDIIRTEARELIEPLDRLPFPARDLLSIRKGDAITAFSSRGCPYKCVYCFSSRFFRRVRFHSPEYVLRELRAIIQDYAPLYIEFYDDLFIADNKRLRQIVHLIEQEKINKKVTFLVNCRANLVTEEVANLLRRMNALEVLIGFESGSDRTLRYLKGAGITVADGRNAIRLLKEQKIRVKGDFIIGSPEETKEEILETLKFIKTSGLVFVDTFPLTPLPGTPLWEDALAKGLVSENMNWTDWDFFNFRAGLPILSQTLTREELSNLYTLFERERKKRLRRYKLILGYAREALKRPWRIPHFLKIKFKRLISRLKRERFYGY